MVNEDENTDDYYSRITKAIEGSAEHGEIVIKWVAVIEVLDSDGDKGVWSVTSEDAQVWDVLGMLKFAEQKALSRVDMATWAQHTIGNEYDDDEE